MVDTIVRDIRYSLRAIAARPAYSVATVVTLALVIGSGVAILAVANATLVRPLPVPDGNRVLQIFDLPADGVSAADRNPLHTRVFARLRQWARTMDAIEGVWTRDRAIDGDGGEPESVKGGDVTPGIFALFGGAPLAGRTFSEEDTRTTAKVAVLSYALWQRRFGGDPAVIGRRLAIDRESYTVIGVMPAAFEIASTPHDVWTPLDTGERTFGVNASLVATYGRLARGQSLAAVQAELDSLMPRIAAEAPDMMRGWHLTVTTLRDALFGGQRAAVIALMAAVLTLALIACANLANLAIAQALSRRHEFVLRAALGGSRAAILRLHVFETALLTMCGLTAGVALGAATIRAALSLDPTTSHALESATVDWRVQLAAVALAAAVAGLSGVLPVWRELRRDLTRAISENSSRSTGTVRDQRARDLLMAAQAASLIVLLAAGALLGAAFLRASRLAPGFDPVNVLTAQIRISAASYPDETRREQFITRVLEHVRAVPGVLAAGTTLNTFTPGDSYTTLMHLVGRPTPDGRPYTVQFRRISSGYFATMRIPFVRGRDFAPTDRLDTAAVAVVSRQFADRYFPGEDPIGRGVTRGINPTVYTIVGIVEDVSDIGLNTAPAPTLYVTYTQNNVAVTPVSLVARTSGPPASFARAVREAVRAADARQPIDDVASLEQFLADSLGPQRFRAVLMLAMSVLAMVIAAVGISGLTSRAVVDRRRELGIRLALGARPSGLVAMVAWRTLRWVLAGIAAGAVLLVPASLALTRTLPNVAPGDVWSILPAAAALLGAAVVATVVPAAKAAAADPILAIRAT